MSRAYTRRNSILRKQFRRPKKNSRNAQELSAWACRARKKTLAWLGVSHTRITCCANLHGADGTQYHYTILGRSLFVTVSRNTTSTH